MVNKVPVMLVPADKAVLLKKKKLVLGICSSVLKKVTGYSYVNVSLCEISTLGSHVNILLCEISRLR